MNFRIETGKSPLQHSSAIKSESGACLAVCLKYQWFQPKCAYKLRAYKTKYVYLRRCPLLQFRDRRNIQIRGIFCELRNCTLDGGISSAKWLT